MYLQEYEKAPVLSELFVDPTHFAPHLILLHMLQCCSNQKQLDLITLPESVTLLLAPRRCDYIGASSYLNIWTE